MSLLSKLIFIKGCHGYAWVSVECQRYVMRNRKDAAAKIEEKGRVMNGDDPYRRSVYLLHTT